MLELTESALLRRDERLHSELAELKGIGVKLAIDDFGTGYSSLSYLRDLPIDVVKMDKSFVEGIADSDQRLALAEGIVQIARTLSLDVIAEGIETEVQRDLLSSMDCHYGQGFLLAMPMPLAEAEELARNGFTSSRARSHAAALTRGTPWSSGSSPRRTGPTWPSRATRHCSPTGRNSYSTTGAPPSSWAARGSSFPSSTCACWKTAPSPPAAGRCRCGGTARPANCPTATTARSPARWQASAPRPRRTRCASWPWPFDPGRQRAGLAGQVITALRDRAAEAGLRRVVVPVRPTLKSRYPLTPMADFARWARPDGLHIDPWIRTHQRLGAEILCPAPRSMIVTGTVAEWQDWTGMAFPQTGRYVVPGALDLVEMDAERDQGSYAETNLWMRHA